MAVNELKDYIENGTILHSVNYPDVNAGAKSGEIRVCVNHKNAPGIIANYSAAISANGGNIVNLVSKSRGDYAYSVFDVDGKVDSAKIAKLEGVLRVRVI